MKKDSTNLDKSDIWLFWISCFFESRLLRFDLDSMLPMQQYVLFVFLAVFASSEIIVKIFVFWPVNFYYFGFDLPNWKRRSQNKNESRISYDSKLMKIYEWGKLVETFGKKQNFCLLSKTCLFQRLSFFPMVFCRKICGKLVCESSTKKKNALFIFGFLFNF